MVRYLYFNGRRMETSAYQDRYKKYQGCKNKYGRRTRIDQCFAARDKKCSKKMAYKNL